MAGRDLEDFRRAFRSGERVVGRVLSRPDARHALVDISGFELLAATDTDPPLGSRLTFSITRMHPVVVLRELARDHNDPNADLPRRIAGLLSSLAGARAAFEPHLSGLRPPPAPSPGQAVDLADLKRRFLAALCADEPAFAAYRRLSRLTRELAALPGLSRLGKYLYAPWYPPGAVGHELLLGRPGTGGAREIHLAFRLEGPGEVRVKALYHGDTARCLVFAAAPERLDRHMFLPEAVRLGRKVIRLLPMAAPRPLGTPLPSLAQTLLGNGTGSFTGVNLRV
ncbi:hypothetical protein [Desulfolutivibrio sulfodismutans]|uniref:hypothetical protein n=1 Tax=Desulfolutivibrio sulfodismutans TaxID=63561 RepID=UPI00159DA3B4|nr:hypothetical protein [Desulfolutivibrio sulfodismutans]QLA11732.1 hypothetical protein GD606_05340 [Desulfolutivibrio sulfodismutans DSM 3696]